MELPKCVSINQFHFVFFQLLTQRVYLLTLRSVLYQSHSQLKYHFTAVFGNLLLLQDERSVISCSCELQREIEKKGLVENGGAVQRIGLLQSCCKTLVPKVVLQQAFPGLCREGGRQFSVAVQSRDPLFPLTPMPGLQGKGRCHWLGVVTRLILGLAGWRDCWGQEALAPLPSMVRVPLLLKFLIYSPELMSVLMSEVLSVFTRAENLLSKSKFCAKTESQTYGLRKPTQCYQC